MYIVKKYTGNATSDTLTKLGNSSTNVKEIMITNYHHSANLTVTLFLERDSTQYIILNTDIPAKVSLVLDSEAFKFNTRDYDLKITSTGSTTWSIIIT
tara:strand:- start:104 stop:397 length:294 start_codon:yes stop_codon:yes gene_type:complete